MDKEDGIHVYHGISLNHKKERTWVILVNVDRRECHTAVIREYNSIYMRSRKTVQMNLFAGQE